jgi:integrase
LDVDTVEDVLAEFVGFCLKSDSCKASIKTILGYVNGVFQFHAAHRVFLKHSPNRWARTLQGMHRYAARHHPARPTTRRRPITPSNISKMTALAQGTIDAHWFPAACEFMFAAFLRKCETFPRKPSQFDPAHDPTIGDLVFTVDGEIVLGHHATWDKLGAARRGRRGTRRPASRAPDHLVYRAKHTKHCGPAAVHARYDNVAIALVDDNSAAHLNGVAAMYRMCADRNDGPHQLTADSPLFVYDGTTTPASADQFNRLIKSHLAAAGEPTIGRSSHSMRHGAASHAIICGVDPAAVRRLGRWVANSSALDVYIHNSFADARRRAASTDFVAPTPLYIQSIIDHANLSTIQPRTAAA